VTIRNLDKLFAPRSLAVIGASTREGSVGDVLARNIANGGYGGETWAVNPHHRSVHGMECFARVEDLPVAPDLAVIATPGEAVPGIIAELGAMGTRATVVISAGIDGYAGDAGKGLRSAMLEAARPHTLRIIGPNCLGVMVPGCGINASFAHLAPHPGNVAFVTQSGAIVTSMLDWAATRGIGFSKIVCLGDMSDVDFGDMLDYLASDQDSKAVLLYIESVTGARKFVSAARAAVRMKPVIVVKGGRFAAGARAAATHTGAMMGSDAVYEAVFARTGMVRAYTLQELFNAAETLGHTQRLPGERLAILTNGGGMGVLATDAVTEKGGSMATLDDATLAGLDAVLPPNWSRENPVDIIGDADPQRYANAAAILTRDPNIDVLLAIHCPTAVCSSAGAAAAVIEATRGRRRPLLLSSWVGDDAAEEARELFGTAGVPSYATPEDAIQGFMHAVQYERGQRTLMETPPSIPERFTPQTEIARDIVATVIGAGRTWLDEAEAKALLNAYNIEAVPTEQAATPEDAAAIAARIGGPVALKIVSADIPHKTDVGGVVLDIAGPAAVRAAAAEMWSRISAARPDAHLQGFSVEPMVRRPGAYELILGMSCDAQFGPVLVFGHGGTAVEAIDDRALALPPLNLHLAEEMISRTRIARLLAGARGLPAANIEALAIALVNLSQLVCDIAEIAELDINPLLADEYGVIALDARFRVAATTQKPAERLAIRPYPRELEEELSMPDGAKLLLRPIRPEDEPTLQRGFAALNPEEIYMRFFTPLKTLTHAMAARFTQLDYDREMALVLTTPGPPGEADFLGSVRIVCDPDMQRAEFAIIIRHDVTGKGLGVLLMRRIMDYCRSRGIAEIFGEVLSENLNMLNLCRFLGFTIESKGKEPAVVTVRLRLDQEAGQHDDASRSPS